MLGYVRDYVQKAISRIQDLNEVSLGLPPKSDNETGIANPVAFRVPRRLSSGGIEQFPMSRRDFDEVWILYRRQFHPIDGTGE